MFDDHDIIATSSRDFCIKALAPSQNANLLREVGCFIGGVSLEEDEASLSARPLVSLFAHLLVCLFVYLFV